MKHAEAKEWQATDVTARPGNGLRTTWEERYLATARMKARLSRGTQIPEYVLKGCLAAFNPESAELFVLKSRTET
jgi:hypothetical protein